ncbi:hypothetical protein [Roseomonas sp. CECT 9278]|uniref:hypothetical protein n=1 Tax=Roseomonas sp. CECT 9278 TaxID=2845823 RepID=UPI001E6413B6|nr:hypothetical protein [Roseomonas sp. CECT 9278]CAH0298668.1 hypothetical protein ROS9278_04470 [Roseomonas sp. CECT 9278]
MAPRRIPVAIRFMLLHGLVGFGLAAMFVGAVLWADPGGVGRLILREGGAPVVALLWFFTGLTFGSVQIGAAVMLLGGQDDAPRGGRRQRLPPALVPVRLAARR